MLADIGAVMWKECLETLLANRDRLKICLRLLLFMTIVAAVFPVPIGDENQRNTAWFQLWCLIPMLIVMGIIPDAVAGERERRTLETLLASRLSEQAIVLGKMAVAIIYAWSLTILSSFSLLIKINIINKSQQLEFYPVEFFFSGLVSSLLVAILVASISVLVSLKAESIKQAYQRVTIAVFTVTLLPSITLASVVFFLPLSVRQSVVNKFIQTGSTPVIFIALLCLAVLDLILVTLVLKRFQRTRLVFY